MKKGKYPVSISTLAGCFARWAVEQSGESVAPCLPEAIYYVKAKMTELLESDSEKTLRMLLLDEDSAAYHLQEELLKIFTESRLIMSWNDPGFAGDFIDLHALARNVAQEAVKDD